MIAQPSPAMALCAATLLAVMLVSAPGSGDGDEATGGDTARATFAGGCFWCMEPLFEQLDGVLAVTSGYTGGGLANPTYAQVATGETGHAESVDILYDPARIDYRQLLDVYWKNIDPLTEDVQFCAVGSQYRTAIFYHDEMQRRLAEASRAAAAAHLQRSVFTEVVRAGAFYPAGEEHQDYSRKHPEDYREWRRSCQREQRLRELWGETTSAHAGIQ